MGFRTLVISEYVIECDNCGTQEVIHNIDLYINNNADAKKAWREDGWSIGKKCLCLNCNRNYHHKHVKSS